MQSAIRDMNADELWIQRRIAAIHMSMGKEYSNPREMSSALQNRQNEMKIVLDFMKRRQDEVKNKIKGQNKLHMETIDSWFALP